MRQLSHWGWGFEDRYPDANVRMQLAMMAYGAMGLQPPAIKEAVPLSEANIPPSRLDAQSAEIEQLLERDDACRARHTWGRSWPEMFRGYKGDFSGAPDAVAFPTTEQEVAQLLRWASAEGVAVIPRGGGTSVTGGVDGSQIEGLRVVLSLEKMDRLLEVDRTSLLARVQAGATGPRLDEQLKEHGLTFRHFPQSWELSTVGGWLVTRAGGHYATVYTHMEDLVASCRMVTPEGNWESRTLPGSGAGPSPDRFVAGSEGILGVVTDATLRVQRPPRFRSTATLKFPSFAQAYEAAAKLAQSDLHPTNCRLLDATEALLNQVSGDGTHLLIVGFESADHPTEVDMQRALALAEACGGTCPDGPQHREDGQRSGNAGAAGAWKKNFLDGPYRQSWLMTAGLIADTFETATTWSKFPELHAAITEAVSEAMQRECGAGILSCRFTHVYPDGPAPYYTWLAPGRPGDELEQWRAVKEAAGDAINAMQATITHHHAVGRYHRKWYDQQVPSLFARAIASSKHALDPSGVLNPGVLIDDQRSR